MALRAALFVNGGSRRGADSYEEALAQLTASGFDMGATCICPPEEMTETVREAADNHEVIFVGGGDGTMRLCAAAIAGTSAAMGIIPLGTGNALARDLEIPLGIGEAASFAARSAVRYVDVAEANGNVFVNLASIGLIGEVTRRLDSQMKRILGRAAYLRPVADTLESASPFQVSIQCGEKVDSFLTMLAAVGCGATQGGVFPLPGSPGIGTGRLTVYALQSIDFAHYAELLWRMKRGTAHEMPNLFLAHVESVTLSAAPSQAVIIDGEPIGPTPVDIVVRPRALKVLASPPQTAS